MIGQSLGGTLSGRGAQLYPSRYFVDPNGNSFHYESSISRFSYQSKFLQPTTWKPAERKALVNSVKIQLLRDSADGLNASDNTMDHLDVDWDQVQTHVASDKSAMECLMQYRNVEDPRINKKPWTESEIEFLTRFVRDKGNNWALCAETMGTGRTPFQCISYYQQCINNSILKTDDWTEAEDLLLKRACSLYDMDWTRVSSCLLGRTAKQCLERWRRHVAPQESLDGPSRRGRWEASEERLLYLAAVACDAPTAMRRRAEEKKAFTGWSTVAEFVPTRDAMKCREKWTNVLDPFVNREPFLPEEDRLLLELCEHRQQELMDDSDTKFWSNLALQFPNRTDNQIYRRWRNLVDSRQSETLLRNKRLKKAFTPSAHGRKAIKTENSDALTPDASTNLNVVLFSRS